MVPEMPESGTEKGVEPRELSLTESGDSHVPLLSADPEKAKEEDTEDEKSRELRLNEDIRVRPNLVSNLCYAFAFFLGLCIAMFIFARDPHMGSTLAEKTPGFLHAAAHEVQRRSSWMVRQSKKLMGVQKPFLWMVWAEESSLESEEFLRRCVDRWHSFLSSDFEVHLVEAKHFDLWLNSSALPQNFGDLPSKVQEDILKVALLAHFGGVLVDVDSIPIQQDSMMQIWTSLQDSDAQALGTYSYHQECQWSLGMWFLAAKKGSAFMKHWLKLLLEEIGDGKKILGSHPEMLYMAKSLFTKDKSFQCEELPPGMAWLLQYQAEEDQTKDGASPILRARSRCASDLVTADSRKKAKKEEVHDLMELKHSKRPLVQDPTGWLEEWNSELGKEAEGCYLDLRYGFEDLRGEGAALTVPSPEAVPAFDVEGRLQIKQLVPAGVPGRWLQPGVSAGP